ncbi:MarR family winged helix-turn-helix transcriptional regulator [Actinoplanes friuliensis]|uniref:Transcriptional regulator n=1 Tax=Actinoplanes friuliensis DSM 7358 TaxID=1246995 RepID=U5VTC0_9ACTN|nr:MarR family transcriptional regulator [Actinoplanes friuliensis]AGZ38985.1 transcriptional regulator [Actinoplanes friuliensis DSM 7358]
MASRNSLEAVYREYLAALVLFHQSAAHAVGLGPTDYQALNLLELRGPQTPGALSAALGLTTGATTRLVDRLVAAGYAERAADPHDRRKVTVTATMTPEDLAELLDGVRGSIAGYVSTLDEAQRDVLVGYWQAAGQGYAKGLSLLTS